MNPQEITIKSSPHSVKDTIDKLQAVLQSNGVTIYARIDQQAELHKTGQIIPPFEFILFGNPKSGGPIMIENPVAALDLPLKVIAWQDNEQKVWVAYNTAAYIKGRYSLSDQVSAPIDLDPLMVKVLG
ncbi:DUF302 domain-containing protein [Mucilaginibacter sp. X4EP1]|uniref:DUF302 domain-containing protein n=1 Tax=Mucilaginibacter sp. X4EP1 TaxID=2723092 RepID=UPI00216A6C7F|nr:DUF302 domain-containing protein [Mucilaginibacter sp. X4EP1]MCS3813658.1 uncharacterized protein (DUF302 family) [Mucilaginibacter sp. X4EP1]